MRDIDIRFDETVFTEFPVGWQRPSDFTEAFLLVAAMELDARRRVSPESPFDESVFPQLADRFRYDPFASLLSLGGLRHEETSTPTVRGGTGPLEAMDAVSRGERLSRLPLLQLVWQYIDVVRAQLGGLDFLEVLQRLEGTILGAEGTILFVTGLDRQMHHGDELTPTEISFIQGRPISMPAYLHRLANPRSGNVPIPPNGGRRVKDIWTVCFRLIERSSTSSVLGAYSERSEPVQAILDRGAVLGRAGARNLWPGWPTDLPVSGVSLPSVDPKEEGNGSPTHHTHSVGTASVETQVAVDWSSAVKAVAAGLSHSLTLRDDGTVAAFGSNDDGQCGVPDAAHGARSVACGGSHSLAVTVDGGLVAWGGNLYRQAEPPVGLGNVAAVAGGHLHSLALLSDGTVVQWGNAPERRPVPDDLRDVVAISAGYEHSLALTKHGRVVAWGSNAKGQLNVPAELSEVVAISAGGWQCFALRRDGSVEAWGEGGDGATEVPVGLTFSAVAGGYWHAVALGANGPVAWGDDEYRQARVPFDLLAGSRFTAIAAGGEHNVALKADGSVVGWGRNDSGQIDFLSPVGFSRPPAEDTPDESSTPPEGQEFQTVWGWGSTDDGLLGYTPQLNAERPRRVDGLADVTDVTVLGSTVYAFLQDGAVWGWGANTGGQLSDGSTLDRYRPVRIPTLTDVARIEPGPVATKSDGTTWTWSTADDGRLHPLPEQRSHAIKQIVHLGKWESGVLQEGDALHAVLTDGTVVAWGRNDSGQLGNGSKSRTGELVPTPAPVMVPGTHRSVLGKVTEVMQPLTDVTRLVRAGESVFAVTVDGAVWAWGANRAGQLADGTRDERLSPVRLGFARDVIGLWTYRRKSQGYPWVYALTRSGDVWQWRPERGENAMPERIPELSAVVDLSVSEGCAAALRSDGTVLAWHPDHAFAPFPPARVEGVDQVVAVVAGERSAALSADGTVASWYGAGDPAPSGGWHPGRYTAIPAEGLAGVRKLSTGGGTLVALHGDGTLWTWGAGSRGQLGNGDRRRRLAPAPIESVGPARSVLGGENTVVAIREGGLVTAWGYNGWADNKLALSSDEVRSDGPWDRALGLRGVTSVAIGWSSVVALKSDGTVWATGGWQTNGPGAVASATRPEQVRTLTGITAIAAGHHTKYALDREGTVWAWGDAQANQIGDGAILIPGPSLSGMVGSRGVPVRSLVPGRVVALAASSETAYAVHEDGTVWAWGNNRNGELGNGHQQDMTSLVGREGVQVPRPAEVRGLRNIKAIAAGGSTAYAVAMDGRVWAWGRNDCGQLGAGTSGAHSTQPVAIEGLPPIASVTTSGGSTFATDDEGFVWAWGLNRDGQLGDGTQVDRRAPIRVPSLHGATSITCVGKATFALLPTRNLQGQ